MHVWFSITLRRNDDPYIEIKEFPMPVIYRQMNWAVWYLGSHLLGNLIYSTI